LPAFTALFAIFVLFAAGAIFLVSLKKRGLKTALLSSGIALGVFIAIFFVLLSLTLNIM
jgi:hypothetical protein